jgi:microcystin-dependent protein
MMKIRKLATLVAGGARRCVTLHNFKFGVSSILTLAAVYLFVPQPHHARAQFADQGTWAGTAAGAANAVILNLANVSSLNDIVGVPIRFNAAANNTGPVTIVIQNALGSTTATALNRPSSIGLAALSLNELWAGETTSVTYNGSVFVLSSNVDMTRIGDTVQYRGGAVPRGTLIEDGSCISQTTYAPLFSVIGTTYGSCSTGLFSLPDSRGTGFVALDGQGVNGLAGRITTATCATPNAVGICGKETATLTLPQLPTGITSSNPTQNITVGAGGQSIPISTTPFTGSTSNTGGNNTPITSGSVGQTTSLTGLNAISVTSNNTLGNAHSILNPASLGRRAVKY